MARSVLSMDASEMDKLIPAITNFPGDAEKLINNVLHDEAGTQISASIIKLLPESGRKWAGKKNAAKKAQPFTQSDGNLSVTVRTKNAYHYLYFPDDGSNTARHYGNQQFMLQGADVEKPKIIDRILGGLIQGFEEGAN